MRAVSLAVRSERVEVGMTQTGRMLSDSRFVVLVPRQQTLSALSHQPTELGLGEGRVQSAGPAGLRQRGGTGLAPKLAD